MSAAPQHKETVSGLIVTPSGAEIPVTAELRPETSLAAYSHVGEIDIPDHLIPEYERDAQGFEFRAETGEEFSAMHMLAERGVGGELDASIVLLREVVGES
jgi:hypothetical protein